jgi:tetratricopeptide (TPR) repeat protein
MTRENRRVHPRDLWDFDDPAGSERRFRDAAAAAEGVERAVWLTQVARALGLQERYAEGHLVLDRIRERAPEVRCRVHLERGRLHRSSGDPIKARRCFGAAIRAAAAAALDELHVDALHMLALVSAPERRISVTRRALAVAYASPDPRARAWDASLFNNLGMALADEGDFDAAVFTFELAVRARLRHGNAKEIRVARWMVAWALRNIDRHTEALAIQRALKAELDAIGEVDPYVDEELALLESATDGGSAGP